MNAYRYALIAAVALVLAPTSVLAQTRDNNRALGNPSGATASTSNPNNYLIDKDMYSMSYNKSKGQPNWVSWHLSKAWYGTAPRSSSFTADTQYLGSTGWPLVFQNTYTNSGFDRGHMCPSADRDKTSTENKVTFHGDNIIPQAHNNNSGPWAKLEDWCRSQCDAGYEMYIVTGPSGSGGVGNGSGGSTATRTSITGPKSGGGTMTVAVPSHTWKVIVMFPNGTSDTTRTPTRCIAIKVPNSDTATTLNTGWGGYRVSIASIESLTGYKFFASNPNVNKSSVDSGPTN